MPKQRLVQICVENDGIDAPLLYHEEPIYRDGISVGYTSSGQWGHRLGKSMGMGYISCKDGVGKKFLKNGNFELEVAKKRYKIKIQFAPFYDPKSKKVRC